MISLMKGVLSPSTSLHDKFLYINSLGLNLSLSSEKDHNKQAIAVGTLQELISSSETRFVGLQVLEMALAQNFSNIFNKGKWLLVIFEVLKDPKSGSLEKQQACKALSLIIPNIASELKEELIKDVLPFLLEKLNENVEWAQEAGTCIKICLQSYPNLVAFYQTQLLEVILHQASYCISSDSFEVFAECFAELPNCVKENGDGFKDRWMDLYMRTLKTIDSLLIESLGNEPYSSVGINAEEFKFNEDSGGFFQDFTKRVHRFVHLCTCLAKLVSSKSRDSVRVPVLPAIKILLQLFSVCRKDNMSSNQETLCTFIAQMKLGGLVILKSLVVNCPLNKYPLFMIDLIRASIDSSLSPVSSELISEHRIGTWKVLSSWLDMYGSQVIKNITDAEANVHIVAELQLDSAVHLTESSQGSKTAQENSKSKKDLSSNNSISLLKRNNEVKVCIAALDCLDSLLITGIRNLSKDIFQQICHHVFKICDSIDFKRYFMPHPYDDESCRERLYTIVLTILESAKPDDHQILQRVMEILRYIDQDPSRKITKIKNRASSRCKLMFYTTRQFPAISEKKKERHIVSNENVNSLWSTQDYVPNIKVSETSDASIKMEPSFASENDDEVHPDEYMDAEPQYAEHVIENQCNGEDIQSSSQCHDDVDSDEEEEEDEEERNFADEDMNQEENPQEIYIPTRKIPSPPPVHIIVESTAEEPEYEELVPCIKNEENIVNSNIKDTCINGERDESLPSSSTQKTNENGIFGVDDNDIDEENDEEDEEEKNVDSYPAEKRESYDHPHPPTKKQKIETKDAAEGEEKDPTLEQMKADFLVLIPSMEEIKSKKAQQSSP